MKQTIDRIARDILGIQTLEYRGRDSLDFHDVSVGSVQDALAAAYQAGQKAADRLLLEAAIEAIAVIRNPEAQPTVDKLRVAIRKARPDLDPNHTTHLGG